VISGYPTDAPFIRISTAFHLMEQSYTSAFLFLGFFLRWLILAGACKLNAI